MTNTKILTNSDIYVLNTSLTHLLNIPFLDESGSIYEIIAIGDNISNTKNFIERYAISISNFIIAHST